jgi:predicted metal-dependent phosphoesterase TrpH
MDAQMDPARKREVADFVIDNDGSLEVLAERAAAVLIELRVRAGGSLRLDLHLHTRGSFDCLSDPEEVLERARALGYGRIAITDHNRLSVALRMAERHPGAVIPGEEVKTAEGVDVIGLYLREEIPKGTPALETIERIRAQGGIPYLPHPYARGKGAGGDLADELARHCDVVEVFNARLHAHELNARAEELAARHGKLRGAGSDAHTVREIGNAAVEVQPHANTADALRAALAGATSVGGTPASPLVHLASTWAKVRKKLPGAPPAAGPGAATDGW